MAGHEASCDEPIHGCARAQCEQNHAQHGCHARGVCVRVSAEERVDAWKLQVVLSVGIYRGVTAQSLAETEIFCNRQM